MDRKIIANKELEVIGGKPKVYRYWDEKEKKRDENKNYFCFGSLANSI